VRWLLKRRLSGSGKRAALDLIRHLQTMYAYQQLAMERFNDAQALAARSETPAGEGLVRWQVPIWDRAAVIRYVIPALETKIEILAEMEREHHAVAGLAVGPMTQTYNDFKSALTVLQERARLQYQGFTAWSQDPSREADITSLDAAEEAAMTRSTESLNGLIAKAGLKEEAWLDICCEAFNTVRASVGLSPMSGDDHRSRFFAGLAGMPARFFRD